jgi:hypothetical protein
MNRTMILIVALTGAAGLAIGWLAPGSRTEPATATIPRHEVRKPPVAVASTSPTAPDPERIEFALRQEDVANDRETPSVAADAAGRVVLAWAAQTGEAERTLYLARSADGGKTFDPPSAFRKVSIYKFTSQSKGKAVAYSTHVLPRLVAASDGLYLGWVEAIDGGPEVAYYIARSGDGGTTFSEPVRPHGKDASKPGFTTLTAAPDGTLLAAWLDGRDKGQQPFFASRAAASEGFEPERLVFAGSDGKGICPCCDLAVARLPDGSDVVAFRNSDAGHRDIWLAHASRDGAFHAPAPLSLDNWTFEGCPHDGPSLALNGDRLHAAWMSAHTGRNRVYVASSATSDLAFTPTPRELSGGTAGAQGHPKLASAGHGRLYVVWDESLDDAPTAPAVATKAGHGHGHGPALTGSGRAVMLAMSTVDGSSFSFEPASPVAPRSGAFQLNPSLAVGLDGAVLVTWNEIDTSGKRVVFVRREPVKEHR